MAEKKNRDSVVNHQINQPNNQLNIAKMNIWVNLRDDVYFNTPSFPFLRKLSVITFGCFDSQLIRYARACSKYDY